MLEWIADWKKRELLGYLWVGVWGGNVLSPKKAQCQQPCGNQQVDPTGECLHSPACIQFLGWFCFSSRDKIKYRGKVKGFQPSSLVMWYNGRWSKPNSLLEIFIGFQPFMGPTMDIHLDGQSDVVIGPKGYIVWIELLVIYSTRPDLIIFGIKWMGITHLQVRFTRISIEISCGPKGPGPFSYQG